MSQQPLYGGETVKAIENFPISGEPVPISVIHWLARIKGAAAAVNGELGLLKPALVRKIEKGAKKSHSSKRAKAIAWATVNKETHGGKKSGSGRGKKSNTSSSKRGGKRSHKGTSKR